MSDGNANTNIDLSSLISLLPLLNTSKSGKATAGNLSSMMDYLTSPWLGVLTGGYDPLSSVPAAPSRYQMDQIANDPNAPTALKSIAASISQGVPLYQVLKEIDSLPDKSGYTSEELKTVARQLGSEQQQFVESQSKAGTDIFTKAGLPAFTERYSDRPELAPLAPETRRQMESLTGEAGGLQREYLNMLATAQREAAGYKKPTSRAQAEEAVRQAEAGYRMAMEKIPTEKNPVANITENPFGVTYGDNGVSMTPNTPANMQKLAAKALSDLNKAKKILAATPKDKTPAFNKTWGDFNDPKVVARYLEAQGKIQKANRLKTAASDIQSRAIAQGEAQGRTPLMDMLANRILASRLMGA
jgi:hypothetical protein